MADRYPSVLPGPKADNYGFGQQDNKQITPMVSGYRRQRTRFAPPPPTYRMTYRFTGAELAIYRAWWLYGTNDGEEFVQVPVYVPERGYQLTSFNGRFLGRYSDPVYVDVDLWEITVDFELAEETVLTESQYTAALVSGEINLAPFTARFRNILGTWPNDGRVFNQ